MSVRHLSAAALAALVLGTCLAAPAPTKPRPTPVPARPPRVLSVQPDLAVTAVRIEDEGAPAGERLGQGAPYVFVCAWVNNGLNGSGASTLAHYLDGARVATQPVGPVPARGTGSSGWTYAPGGQTPGPHTYACVLDEGNAVAEGQEANNRKEVAFETVPSSSPSCRADRDCDTGNCVDGVCCDTPCEGNCRYCAFPGHVGTCRPVPDRQNPRRACQGAVGGHPACAGACFEGQCAFPDVGTPCGTCASCDGTGRCTATPADDAACGVVECSGLDTAARVYQDLTAGRCASLGTCKAANDPATCTLYRDLGR